jgi:AMP deaminase
VFLKTENEQGGQYFADLMKLVSARVGKSEFNEYIEPRLSIYGRKSDDWSKLADWAYRHKLIVTPGETPLPQQKRVKWMIQIPRLFRIFAGKCFDNFEEMLRNIFDPMFEATLDPEAHPKLHALLSQVGGIDCVDDEGLFDPPLLMPSIASGGGYRTAYPAEFTGKGASGSGTTGDASNPPYSYYLYYIYANLKVLNDLRRAKGMNTMAFKPHCGECGEAHHLSTAFLLADSVNHGIRLELDSGKTHTLQYLYYLAQVGLAACPLSNDSLFIPLQNSPVGTLFKRGLRVALGTDDPLQFHATPAPLIEEYTIAKRMFGLSSVDLCEMVRSSCLISTFSNDVKRSWHGPECLHTFDANQGTELPHLPFIYSQYFMQNDPHLTNVPSIRSAFRRNNLMRELAYVTKVAAECTEELVDKPASISPPVTSEDNLHIIRDRANSIDARVQSPPLPQTKKAVQAKQPAPAATPATDITDIVDTRFVLGFAAGVCAATVLVLAGLARRSS